MNSVNYYGKLINLYNYTMWVVGEIIKHLEETPWIVNITYRNILNSKGLNPMKIYSVMLY